MAIPYGAFPGLIKQAWQALEGFQQRLKQHRKNGPQLESLVIRYELLIDESLQRLDRLSHLETNQESLDVSRRLDQMLKDIDRYTAEFDELVRLRNKYEGKHAVHKLFRAISTGGKVTASEEKALQSHKIARLSAHEVSTTESLAALHDDVTDGHRKIEHSLSNNERQLVDILSEINQLGSEVTTELRGMQNKIKKESHDFDTCSTVTTYFIFFWLAYVLMIRPFLPESFAEYFILSDGPKLVEMSFFESVGYYYIWLIVYIIVIAVPVVMYRVYQQQQSGAWSGFLIIAFFGFPFALFLQLVWNQTLTRLSGNPDLVMLFGRKLTFECVAHFYIWLLILLIMKASLYGFLFTRDDSENESRTGILSKAFEGVVLLIFFCFLGSQLLGRFNGEPDFVLRFLKRNFS